MFSNPGALKLSSCHRLITHLLGKSPGGGGGVLGLKTDGGVPLAAENWTQKDRGKN